MLDEQSAPKAQSSSANAPPRANQTATSTTNNAPIPRKPYPIVLAHGLGGFDRVGPVNYFYGVADVLRADGYEVFTPAVDPFNSSEVRGAQLLKHVHDVLAQTGATKVNLIGHSQGGFDSRYVASVAPENIASVVTISTPHQGTAISDIALGTVDGPAREAMTALLNMFGTALTGRSKEDSNAAIAGLSGAASASFTRRYPDSPFVDYYSIAGRSNMQSGTFECATSADEPFISDWNSTVDSVDPLLSPTAAILNSSRASDPANDGLVAVSSARWGTFLGCIPADHLDEICQIANDAPGGSNGFNCHQFYRRLAAWLVLRGY